MTNQLYDGLDSDLAHAAETIKSLEQQLAEANAKVAELESINTFDAKRLRTLTNLLGMSVPESDETLLSCAGTVLGGMRRVIEDMFKTTNDLTAKVAELEAVNAKFVRDKYPFVHLMMDASEAEKEGALRSKMIELGWTPPSADLTARLERSEEQNKMFLSRLRELGDAN